MGKTTNKVAPEVRVRAVRMVQDHEGEHASRWAALVSISEKIGCSAHTLNEWVKKAEVDGGKRAGVPTELADRLKALECENRELRQHRGGFIHQSDCGSVTHNPMPPAAPVRFTAPPKLHHAVGHDRMVTAIANAVAAHE